MERRPPPAAGGTFGHRREGTFGDGAGDVGRVEGTGPKGGVGARARGDAGGGRDRGEFNEPPTSGRPRGEHVLPRPPAFMRDTPDHPGPQQPPGPQRNAPSLASIRALGELCG
jgi:hypothetical protein